LFPSLFEGLPLSPLEAMMHRLPVIISDATGNRDLFEDRSDGLVFRNGDSCDLMECVNYALANPEAMKILAEKAMKKLNLFSEVRMLEEFQSIVSTSFADRP
jgi:glycosyltransferase involved in cell wall biosynthesis